MKTKLIFAALILGFISISAQATEKSRKFHHRKHLHDRREDVRDRKEDKHDRREDVCNRRENRRDRRKGTN
jgi:hypothetical protein